MESFALIFITSVVLVMIGHAYYCWVNKVDLERKYLQSLLKEDEKQRNVIRKDR